MSPTRPGAQPLRGTPSELPSVLFTSPEAVFRVCSVSRSSLPLMVSESLHQTSHSQIIMGFLFLEGTLTDQPGRGAQMRWQRARPVGVAMCALKTGEGRWVRRDWHQRGFLPLLSDDLREMKRSGRGEERREEGTWERGHRGHSRKQTWLPAPPGFPAAHPSITSSRQGPPSLQTPSLNTPSQGHVFENDKPGETLMNGVGSCSGLHVSPQITWWRQFPAAKELGGGAWWEVFRS